MTERIKYFDLAKGLCITLVVLYHLQGAYSVELPTDGYLSLVRMPLYFFLSGFFFKDYGGWAQLIVKKTNKLLVPFLFFYLTTSVLLPIACTHLLDMHFSTGGDWSLLWAFLLPDAKYPNIPLWFLWGLFWSNILFCALRRAVPKEWAQLLLACCIGGIFIADNAPALPASFDRTLAYMPFFIAGNIFRGNSLQRFLNGKAAAVLLLMFIAGGYCHPEGTVAQALQRYVAGMCGILCLIQLCARLGSLPYFSYVGRYSIMVLVTHEPLIRLLHPLDIGLLPELLLIMALYLAIIPFMRRFMPHVTAQKDLFKTQTTP